MRFCRLTVSALKSRHEHQRQGGILTAGTAGDWATGEGCHNTGSSSEAGRQETRGAELHPLLLRQGRGAHPSRIGTVGEGSRAVQAQVVKAGDAIRAESEDAGILRAGV